MESLNVNGTPMWPILLGTLFDQISVFTKQSVFQRCISSTKSVSQARSTALAGQFLCATITFVLTLTGMAMYAKYIDCDPVLSKKVNTRDQATLLFAAETLSFASGLTGVYFAALACSALSTVSSHINSTVTSIMEDFIRPSSKMTESQSVKVAKALGVAYGGVAVVLVFLIQQFRGVVSAYFIVNGMFSGPILGLFTIGMLSPWTSSLPALLGCSSSMLFIAWVSIGRLLNNPQSDVAALSSSTCNATSGSSISNLVTNGSNLISNGSQLNNSFVLDDPFKYYFPLSTFHPYWYICWSTLLAVVLGLLATAISCRQNPDNVDPDLLFPFVVKIIRGLPTKWKLRLGFVKENSKFMKGLSISWPISNLRGPIVVVKTLPKECIPLCEKS